MRLNKGYIEDLMYGRRRSLFVEPFLRILSLLYGFGVAIRLALFRIGILKQKKIGQRVISVGNMTLGGTGKTPAVIEIARVLSKSKKHPAVISRGYGRRNESSVLIVSDHDRVITDADIGGDEPVLIGSKLPGVPVVAGSDRFQAAQFAHVRFGNDAVILDDGFQHIRLYRDIDIVLVDAVDPFGNENLFPAGILREPLSGLSRADVVVITNADRAADLKHLRKKIRQHTAARIFTSRHAPADLVNTMTGEIKPLAALQRKRILAFCGIARPQSFMALLRSLGADIKAEIGYPDHYPYQKSDLARLFQIAADEKISMMVTTEKDSVRLKNLKPERVWALRIELKVVEKEEWEAVLLKGA